MLVFCSLCHKNNGIFPQCKSYYHLIIMPFQTLLSRAHLPHPQLKISVLDSRNFHKFRIPKFYIKKICTYVQPPGNVYIYRLHFLPGELAVKGVSNFYKHKIPWGGLLTMQIPGPQSKEANSVGLRRSPGDRVFNKHPKSLSARIQEPHLEKYCSQR